MKERTIPTTLSALKRAHQNIINGTLQARIEPCVRVGANSQVDRCENLGRSGDKQCLAPENIRGTGTGGFRCKLREGDIVILRQIQTQSFEVAAK